MIDDIIFNLFRYGDNLKHGQCTDGKIINNWTGSCTPPGKNRGGGYVRVELRVDGFSSISVRTAPALPEGGSPPPGSALGEWSPEAAMEWGDCSSPSAAFETVTMRLAEPSRLMLNVVASSGGKLLVEVLLPTTTRPSSEGTAAAAAAAAAAGAGVGGGAAVAAAAAAGGGGGGGGGGGLLSPSSSSVLAGYSAANCTEIVGDYTSVAVEWDGGEVLPKGVVSLRFLLFSEVDVYSFWFESESVGSKAM